METIKQLQLTIGVLSTSIGLKNLSNLLKEIPATKLPSKKIDELCSQLGISNNQLDVDYYSTTWDNWKIIISVLYGIIKNFPWLKDRFDCDNRAAFMNSLCALLTGLNTCSDMYCKVTNVNTGTSDMHHPNFIIDSDGNGYIFDVDNYGQFQKVTSKTFVMGTWKYDLSGIRIF